MPTTLPVPPRYGTPRRPSRPTSAQPAINLASMIGKPLMPWQRHVLEVAGELDDNGEHAYRTVVVSVGRRAGKTILALARLLGLTMATPTGGYRAFYTAQHGAAVTKRWRYEWKPLIGPTLGAFVKIRESEGREAFEIPANHGVVAAFAPTPTALHGVDADLIMFDEAWAHDAKRGLELEQAARPTMYARPGGQIWIVSAAGEQSSTWFRRWTDTGRAAALADLGHGVAHFEWTADAPGVDRDDPDEWIRSHPSIRTPDNPTGRLRLEDLADEHDANPDVFYRSVLNIAEHVDAADTALVDGWQSGVDATVGLQDPVTLAVEIDPDRHWCSIVASDGAAVELIEHRPHGEWVKPRLDALVATHRPLAVVWDASGPANSLERELRDVAAMAIPMRTRDVTAASGAFHDAVVTGSVQHRDPVDMSTAVAQARRRTTSGSWVYDRRVPGAGPLVAATLARWAALNPDLRAGQIW